MSNKPSADMLAKVYLKIKAKREQLKREFTAADKVLVEQQDTVRDELKKICNELGTKSLGTEHGMVIKTVKSKYWTSDWESMYKFILDNKAPELLTRSIHQSNLKEFMEEHPDKVPPGLNMDAEEIISVRKPTKKAAA